MMRKARERVGLPGPVGEVIILSGANADTPGDNLDENEDCKIYCLGLSVHVTPVIQHIFRL